MNDFIEKFQKGNIKLEITNSLRKSNLYKNGKVHDEYKKYKCVKFVPASGDATRMFQDLHQYLNDKVMSDNMIKFLYNLDKFAFLNKNQIFINIYRESERLKVVKDILTNELNLSNCPKALIKIHKYDNFSSTAFDEHLYESKLLFDGTEKNVHFTVSENHIESFRKAYEDEILYKDYNVSFSFQDKSTDTLAVDMNNKPFVKENGELLYRAGGHGSLISNLNNLDYDIIFISNVDNVCHRDYIDETIKYKKKLVSVGIDIKRKIDKYLQDIESNIYDLEEIGYFIKSVLNIKVKKDLTKELAFELLNRPFRVVGVVKNVGEPGGGPFFVDNGDYVDVQICEKAELNLKDEKTNKIFQNSEYFNPVNIVCFVKDYKGEKYNLLNFVNENRYFVSEKSYNGTPIKALEHPGLWNGSMHYWNSVFVELPLITFNPIKSILDLLRIGHQKKDDLF